MNKENISLLLYWWLVTKCKIKNLSTDLYGYFDTINKIYLLLEQQILEINHQQNEFFIAFENLLMILTNTKTIKLQTNKK